MATFQIEQPLRLVSRSRDGRWLGGVCAGLGRARGIHPAWIRAAFVAGGLIAGIGVLVYLSCWLIIPQEGEQPGDGSSGWLVGLAKACGACLGLVTLAVLAAGATLFGFGWVALALAAVALLAVLASWPRLGPAWALLPLAGIALPAVAVASSGTRLVATAAQETINVGRLAPGGIATFRSGLGTMLVDLRHTALPATGTLNVRVQGGVRRTIVALPHDRCVHVELTYSTHPFWSQVASLVAGHGTAAGVVVFGAYLPASSGSRRLTSPVPGPVLKLHVTSAGGSLYVRDYPDTVNPDYIPDWPGLVDQPEPRPDVRGLSKGQARYELRAWRRRYAGELRSEQEVSRAMPGPCAAAAVPVR
ncbi:MAG TPA: PspC domain-containing protein [Solirubrobacteraceae bacterium]|nr:PspC domain-containing protein [Solirubrobacteraceae bacterium]